MDPNPERSTVASEYHDVSSCLLRRLKLNQKFYFNSLKLMIFKCIYIALFCLFSQAFNEMYQG